MKKPILRVEDLYYRYSSGEQALKGVSLTIYENQRIALVGANGSGKSTFFLNLNGVFTPDGGKIIYRDRCVDKKNVKELRKKVGIVFQDADHQIIASTVRAEVGFGPMNLKLPKEEVEDRVKEALAYMDMQGYIDRPPHYLSGGEKKRVTIADVIAMKPDIFLFDEPTTALDPQNALLLEDILKKLYKEGKTLLVSVHDVDFVYRWAQRVLVFDKGEIIADASPLEIFKNEELVKRAKLRLPAMLEVYEALVEKGILEDLGLYPKTPKELKDILNSL